MKNSLDKKSKPHTSEKKWQTHTDYYSYKKAIIPSNVRTEYNQALQYLHQKNHAKAIKMFNSIIKKSPNFAEAYYSRAVSFVQLLNTFNQNQRQEACHYIVSDMTRYIDSGETGYLSHALHDRGTCFNELEEYSKALLDLNKTLTISPNSPHSYASRGVTYSALGQCDKAMNDFNQSCQLGIKSFCSKECQGPASNLKNVQADVYYKTKQYAKAVKSYSEQIQNNPNSYKYWLGRGKSYYHLKQYQNAINDLNKALNGMTPELAQYEDALLFRGASFEKLGQCPAANQDFRIICGKRGGAVGICAQYWCSESDENAGTIMAGLQQKYDLYKAKYEDMKKEAESLAISDLDRAKEIILEMEKFRYQNDPDYFHLMGIIKLYAKRNGVNALYKLAEQYGIRLKKRR